MGACFLFAENINAYVLDAPDVFIASRTKSICGVPKMVYGSKPADGGFLFLDEDEKNELLDREPEAAKFVRQILGADEFINNKKRYCLWLVDASPAELRKMPEVKSRIEKVREMRLASAKESTRRDADTSHLFQEIRQPQRGNYILVPRHSSENRRYIPFGFVSPDIICGDANLLIPSATLYHFGILTSSVHMAWMRAVCGRLKSDYRYSKDIVYNNFPWPEAYGNRDSCGGVQTASPVAHTAQAILDARAKYPDSSLADLYDEATMPPELRKAHAANDIAVMRAYGFSPDMTEGDIVASLLKMYERLTASPYVVSKTGAMGRGDTSDN